jgi:hypothetical protein
LGGILNKLNCCGDFNTICSKDGRKGRREIMILELLEYDAHF